MERKHRQLSPNLTTITHTSIVTYNNVTSLDHPVDLVFLTFQIFKTIFFYSFLALENDVADLQKDVSDAKSDLDKANARNNFLNDVLKPLLDDKNDDQTDDINAFEPQVQ